MNFDKAILRVFEVQAKAGKAQLLKSKLADTSVAVVNGKPGNLGYFFGKTLSEDSNDLVFISLWQDIESIQALFGENWQQSYLPEGYAELIDHCSIRHIEFDGSLKL